MIFVPKMKQNRDKKRKRHEITSKDAETEKEMQ